jgi:cobalt/nickel transport protein
MKKRIGLALPLVLLVLLTAPGQAHYHMLLPQSASTRLDKPVTLHFLWGHPFEHQLFNATAPRSLFVIAPSGKKTDLTKKLEAVPPPNGPKKPQVFRLRFTPRQRGDYVFVLTCVPVFMTAEKQFFEDTIKVVLHVEDQEGWDTHAGQPFELVPLTRPYGLQPGLVFQAQVLAGRKPVKGTVVEIERYNAAPPKKLPPDEQVTRTAKTDPNGVVTYTLPEAGWWCLTAQRDGGTSKHKGKSYPVKQRTTFWVYVDEKIVPRKERGN